MLDPTSLSENIIIIFSDLSEYQTITHQYFHNPRQQGTTNAESMTQRRSPMLWEKRGHMYTPTPATTKAVPPSALHFIPNDRAAPISLLSLSL
jgi:hypothetical protein